MSQPVFALIDCNNFFVSCLRLFQPDLEDKPVVALSSNDGCVVARSNEAKALGVPMGAPAFKWRSFFEQNQVIQMSGNFELYGDISKRITSLLTSITPHIEIYSVDESFLDLSELKITNYTEWAREVRRLIKQLTGIPVSIGIAPSKTLAKLASERAKKTPKLNNVLDLLSLSAEGQALYLQQTPVQDVWGVGWRLAPRLMAEGVATAYDLAKMRPQYAQKLMGINGRQLVTELGGTSCYPLQKVYKLPKSIAVTRTFGEDTNQFYVIESALTSFATKAAFRLRASSQLTRRLGFFMTTSRHKPGYVSSSAEFIFQTPTNDSAQIIKAALKIANDNFRSGREYHRAGVWLYDLVPEDSLQIDLLNKDMPKTHNQELSRMQALDSINKRYGRHTAYYASEDLGNAWQPRHQIKTPRYTTRWDELPKIKISS